MSRYLELNDQVRITRKPSYCNNYTKKITLHGEVAYLGRVSFASGDDWVGVCLTGDSIGYGKNNGSVNGKQYFAKECVPNGGLFVRRDNLRLHKPDYATVLRSRRENKCLYDKLQKSKIEEGRALYSGIAKEESQKVILGDSKFTTTRNTTRSRPTAPTNELEKVLTAPADKPLAPTDALASIEGEDTQKEMDLKSKKISEKAEGAEKYAIITFADKDGANGSCDGLTLDTEDETTVQELDSSIAEEESHKAIRRNSECTITLNNNQSLQTAPTCEPEDELNTLTDRHLTHTNTLASIEGEYTQKEMDLNFQEISEKAEGAEINTIITCDDKDDVSSSCNGSIVDKEDKTPVEGITEEESHKAFLGGFKCIMTLNNTLSLQTAPTCEPEDELRTRTDKHLTHTNTPASIEGEDTQKQMDLKLKERNEKAEGADHFVRIAIVDEVEFVMADEEGQSLAHNIDLSIAEEESQKAILEDLECANQSPPASTTEKLEQILTNSPDKKRFTPAKLPPSIEDDCIRKENEDLTSEQKVIIENTEGVYNDEGTVSGADIDNANISCVKGDTPLDKELVEQSSNAIVKICQIDNTKSQPTTPTGELEDSTTRPMLARVSPLPSTTSKQRKIPASSAARLQEQDEMNMTHKPHNKSKNKKSIFKKVISKLQCTTVEVLRETSFSHITHDSPLGISVHALRHVLLPEVKQAGLYETSTIYDIEDFRNSNHGIIRRKGAAKMCPRDGFIGAAYVDCLKGVNNVGPSKRMLSYTWGDSIGDIIDSLEAYCESNNEDPKQMYIWICCLCNNLHRYNQYTPFRKSTFQDNFIAIGHVLALIAPWNKPRYLSRMWCIFEIFTANKESECEVEAIMPPREKAKMLRKLSEYNNLVTLLTSTNITMTTTSKEMDKITIMNLVNNVTDVSTLNKNVNRLLQMCMLKIILAAVDECRQLSRDPTIDMKYAKLCDNVGKIMHQNSKYDEAIVLYSTCLAITEKVYGKEHADTALSYSNKGSVLVSKGDYDEALDMFQECFAVRLKIYGKINGLEKVIMYKKTLAEDEKSTNNSDLDAALAMYRKLLAVEEKIYGKEHPVTATSYNNLAIALGKKCNYKEALEMYEKSLVVLETIYSKDQGDAIKIRRSITDIEKKLG